MAAITWVLDDPALRAMRSVMDAWKVLDAGFTTVRDCCGLNVYSLSKPFRKAK
jgi:hypothetical protein